MKAKVVDIKRFAVHDGDGIRTTVFLKGCPLKCVWCHNPESIEYKEQIAFYKHKCVGCGRCDMADFCPSECLGQAKILYGKDMTVDEVMAIVLEDKEFYDSSGGGVTLSGGECLMQADFCEMLLKKCKENGINTAVDTCGYVPKKALDKVIPYTDIFLFDVKAIDEDVHLKCTGRSNKIILENLKYLDEQNCKIEIRIPYVPEYNLNQMEKIAEFLKTLNNITKVKVLPYHNYAGSKYEALNMENTLPALLPTEEEIQKAEQIFVPYTE